MKTTKFTTTGTLDVSQVIYLKWNQGFNVYNSATKEQASNAEFSSHKVYALCNYKQKKWTDFIFTTENNFSTE